MFLSSNLLYFIGYKHACLCVCGRSVKLHCTLSVCLSICLSVCLCITSSLLSIHNHTYLSIIRINLHVILNQSFCLTKTFPLSFPSFFLFELTISFPLSPAYLYCLIPLSRTSISCHFCLPLFCLILCKPSFSCHYLLSICLTLVF